jgi:glycopeptide antibiotics resistance protein
MPLTRQQLLVRAAYGVTGAFSLVLLWAFLTPVAELPDVPGISDYVWHLVIFAILVLPLMATVPAKRLPLAVLAIAFGTAIEFGQPYFGRGFQIHDLAANALGVCAGWWLSSKITAFFNRA